MNKRIVQVETEDIWRGRRRGMFDCFGPEPNFIKVSELYTILNDPVKYAGDYVLLREDA